MPDNDVVPRRFARYLRSSAKMALGGLPAAEVGGELGRAGARLLRDYSLPPSIELAHALRDIQMYGPDAGKPELRSWFDRADCNPIAACVLREAEYQLEVRGEELAATRAESLGPELVVAGLRRFLAGQLWESAPFIEAQLAQDRPVISAQREYQEAVLEHAQLSDLARRCLEKDSSVIRAPASPAPPSTAEQLDEDISL